MGRTMAANDGEGPFSIGSVVWPGLAKLAEECGELVQVVGKLIATGGRTDHWSGLTLRQALIEEMGDVLAAVAFVGAHNDLDDHAVAERCAAKLAMFAEWQGHKEADDDR